MSEDEPMTFNEAIRELLHVIAEELKLYRLVDWMLETITRLGVWAKRKLEECGQWKKKK